MKFIVLGDTARTLQIKKQRKGTPGALYPFPLCIQSGSPSLWDDPPYIQGESSLLS